MSAVRVATAPNLCTWHRNRQLESRGEFWLKKRSMRPSEPASSLVVRRKMRGETTFATSGRWTKRRTAST
eukprot:13766020-Alexandrium_andersonii.AAC.1